MLETCILERVDCSRSFPIKHPFSYPIQFLPWHPISFFPQREFVLKKRQYRFRGNYPNQLNIDSNRNPAMPIGKPMGANKIGATPFIW
jgi:hypothetical protein